VPFTNTYTKKKFTNSCLFCAAKNAANCNQAAYGLTVVKCLHPAYTTGVVLLEEISQLVFKGGIKSSLREPERLLEELSSAGSRFIPLFHILCLT